MPATSWVPLGLEAVAFVCGLLLLIDLLDRGQEGSGRPRHALGRVPNFGVGPAGVPVVLAGIAALVVIAVATVSSAVAALVTSLFAVITVGVIAGRRLR